MSKFKSNAIWPIDSDVLDEYGRPQSSDTHYHREQALAVCRGLESDGLGGLGEVFPIRTWVTTVEDD